MTSNGNQVDFTPLRHYSRVFKILRIIRRVRMVLVRLLVLAIIAGVFGIIFYILRSIEHQIGAEDSAGSSSYSYEYSYDGSSSTIDLGLLLWLAISIPIIFYVLKLVYMNMIWQAFAKKNGFQVVESRDRAAVEIVSVPSFRGKLLALSAGIVTGIYRGTQFALFTRQYKEGGILRWREHQMDTILMLSMPARLPHIVINARGNERARRSNLSASFPGNYHFRFEGVYGSKYDVYAEPASRITTLQLFTPDVLMVLYDKLPNADIEIQGDKLWIVQRYGVLDDSLAYDLFEASHALYGELEKQVRSARLLEKQ